MYNSNYTQLPSDYIASKSNIFFIKLLLVENILNAKNTLSGTLLNNCCKLLQVFNTCAVLIGRVIHVY